MKKMPLLPITLVAAVVWALMVPGAVSAQGDETISTTVIDEGAFITVKETAGGDVLSLYRVRGDRIYRVRGDRIILVDTVVNTDNRKSSDTSFQKRYLVRLDVENR
jgi:hypothetical protein